MEMDLNGGLYLIRKTQQWLINHPPKDLIGGPFMWLRIPFICKLNCPPVTVSERKSLQRLDKIYISLTKTERTSK